MWLCVYYVAAWCEKSRPHQDFFCPILFVSCTFLSGIGLVLDEGLRAVDFPIMKNPTASVGSEPAILGSRSQHANP
jgi:hypothetical protein